MKYYERMLNQGGRIDFMDRNRQPCGRAFPEADGLNYISIFRYSYAKSDITDRKMIFAIG